MILVRVGMLGLSALSCPAISTFFFLVIDYLLGKAKKILSTGTFRVELENRFIGDLRPYQINIDPDSGFKKSILEIIFQC
jgi:hypothetical protein